MDLETVRKIELVATNKDICLYKRAYASAILVTTHASLRFDDVQSLRTFERNDDSIYGTLTSSKAKKQHCLNWPRACPLTGVTGATDWAQSLLDMRSACRKVSGVDMRYLFHRLDYTWTLVAEGPSPYSTTRRKLAILRAGLGGPMGESYTMHSPKNLFPTAANQMSFGQIELTIIGRWPLTARMPDRYDHSVWPNEMLLRNTIVRKFATGWVPAPAYHIPTTVAGRVRVGKDVETVNV